MDAACTLADQSQLPFKDALLRAQSLISERFHEVNDASDRLGRGMAHAVIGGKMLRGLLAMESCRLHGVAPNLAVDAGVAIECLHAYSLVHDDLPCMDDDALRRGQPTVHVRWDEATAVLVGDALQSLAFEVLSDIKFGAGGMALVRSLAHMAGRHGMVRGQMQDIAAETAQMPLTLDEITVLQENKTGKLILWSCSVGPTFAGEVADPEPLRVYARAIGLAFQIADDILDVEGDTATVGKVTGKDKEAGKATFVSHLGLDGAKRRANELVQTACDALDTYGAGAETLRDAARFIVDRKS